MFNVFFLFNKKWASDLVKDEVKVSEELAKIAVTDAKNAIKFWSEEWGTGKGSRPSKCFER